ncbi:MSMEG_0570 family nitrogen starvation response protein [Celeribacter halophilus]|jgi:putative flavoprotein involved in K+ transport|uniref:MSMEG_0570 family nitrogen starvation response protein n=1 Tax=Celeribacter halophilus TaxID=576117 RepID=UPI001C097F51|nr:MSMEG_0570 family nitrogen starvation response protein [Celeribacter halophilus]MBU2888830.1 MSMEG_0570 family nitrogen starvation response protein [Celeribacter halophilus]MDO6511827.1 MSMEG_0570 family nitrogen starvation response protein [Celeribacter halophilus]
MPETYWTVRWPDGSEEKLYSPSSVIAELFEPGLRYSVPDFLQRARIAMERASNRVERKYGFACSAAMDQLDRIEAKAATFTEQTDAEIACLQISQ